MKTVFWPFCKQFFLQSQALLIGENVDFARLADAAEDMGIQPVAVLSEIHLQTKQLKGNHFREAVLSFQIGDLRHRLW